MKKKQDDSLFKRYAENWGKIVTDPRVQVAQEEYKTPDIFVCPLCLAGFTYDAIKELSEEHVPPASLGGKVRTLTCKSCNHKHGTVLDAPLQREIVNLDFWNGVSGSSKNMRLSFNDTGATLGVEVEIDTSGNFHMVPVKRQSDETVLNNFDNLLKSNKITTFTWHFQRESKKRVEIALLRIGYLWAFSVFGYGLLLNPNLIPIREQIQHPKQTMMKSRGVIIDFQAPDEFLGVNIVTKPSELKSYIVVFDIKNKLINKVKRCGVFLPRMTEPNLEIYDYMEKNSDKINFSISPLKEIDFNDTPFVPTSSW